MPGRGRKTKRDSNSAVCYARVSTAEQAEKELSIPAQMAAMRSFAARHKFEIVKSYEEQGASATDENRKQFRAMLEDLWAPTSKVSVILVFHTSRFMRNVGRARIFKAKLAKAGVRVIAVEQPTDDSPTGRLHEGLYELFDQYESDMNGMRTVSAMRENARQGYFNGSKAPYGYRVEKVEVKPGLFRNKLVVDPTEASVLETVFRTYFEEPGAVHTAAELNRRGLRYRRAMPWTKDLVLKVTGETASCGTYLWGKRSKHVGNDEEGHIIAIGVEPIIPRALFDLAQAKRAGRYPAASKGRTASSPLLLAGLVRCGRCGQPYQLQTSGKRSPTRPDGYRYYNCRLALRAGRDRCTGGALPKDGFERAILADIADRLFTKARCERLLRILVARGTLTRRLRSASQRRKAELAKVEAAIARLVSAIESVDGETAPAMARLQELDRRRQELIAEMRRGGAHAFVEAHLFHPTTIRRVKNALQSFLLSCSSKQAKGYVQLVVEEVIVTNDSVRVAAHPALAAANSTAGDNKEEGE